MRVIDRAGIDKQDLRYMNRMELSELGVRIVNRTDLVLECSECGETWAPQLDASGKLPFDYWLCPAKCNAVNSSR
jgi:ribosomal protein L44E